MSSSGVYRLSSVRTAQKGTFRKQRAKNQNLNHYEQSTNLQNHRDDRSGIADVLRSSAWNDKLQSMADDLDDVKLRSAERQHQDDHHYLHQNRGRVYRRQKVTPDVRRNDVRCKMYVRCTI